MSNQTGQRSHRGHFVRNFFSKGFSTEISVYATSSRTWILILVAIEVDARLAGTATARDDQGPCTYPRLQTDVHRLAAGVQPSPRREVPSRHALHLTPSCAPALPLSCNHVEHTHACMYARTVEQSPGARDDPIDDPIHLSFCTCCSSCCNDSNSSITSPSYPVSHV